MEKLGIEEALNRYPEKETMMNFLEIWKKLWYFETNKTIKWWKEITYYKNVNALYAIAIILEYLNKNKYGINIDWNDTITTKNLLEMVKNETKEKLNKIISEIILKIRENNDKSEYTTERIRLKRKHINEYENFTTNEIPIIWKEYLPNRYWEAISTNLIGKKFEAELSRLEWVSAWANEIRAATKDHEFTRWFNPEDIEELKKDL